MNIAERAYIAGLVDGEGTVSTRINHRNPIRYGPIIAIEMCDKELINWVYEKTNLGKVREIKKRNIKHKTSWRWELIRHNEVKEFLSQIFPYLILKRKNATILLGFPYIKQGFDKEKTLWLQNELSNRIRELNKKGEGHGADSRYLGGTSTNFSLGQYIGNSFVSEGWSTV